MIAPDPDDEQDLFEPDWDTVMNCDHEASECRTAGPAQYAHGPVYIDIIECVGCRTMVLLFLAEDPRDDMYASLPLGN
jgi:hypothetical protein